MNIIDNKNCTHCTNAKYKETLKDGSELYFCGKHKTFITDLTRPSWISGCKGKDFQRRGNES